MALFPDLPQAGKKVKRYKRISQPIWTEHKAKFIQQYLKYFVQITKHGVYIDGFAGPQNLDELDAWTASLVLASEPKWLRRFFLCEIEEPSLVALRKMVADQPILMSKSGRKLPRKVEVLSGDFNVTVDDILSSGKITQKRLHFAFLIKEPWNATGRPS